MSPCCYRNVLKKFVEMWEENYDVSVPCTYSSRVNVAVQDPNNARSVPHTILTSVDVPLPNLLKIEQAFLDHVPFGAIC
jgi:hypothetical protein